VIKILAILFSLLFFLPVLAKDKVLIVSKEHADFVKLATNLIGELGSNFELAVKQIDKSISYEEYESMIEKENPSLVVLIDNQSVSLAQEYFKKKPKSKILGVALMGLNFKKILKNDKHICGIAYEVSPFSLFTQFRSLRADKKLNRILTFYRDSQFAEAIQEAKHFAELEKMELVAIDVEKEKNVPEFLKNKGRKEIDSSLYDAVYVILDSVLLTPELFEQFWIPAAKDAKIPFLIGTEKFVDPNFNFATYGISPNLKDLASQAAQMIESLLSGEKCRKIENLVGVDKFLNDSKIGDLNIKLDENSKSDTTILK